MCSLTIDYRPSHSLISELPSRPLSLTSTFPTHMILFCFETEFNEAISLAIGLERYTIYSKTISNQELIRES